MINFAASFFQSLRLRLETEDRRGDVNVRRGKPQPTSFSLSRHDRFTIELAWSLKKRIPDRNDMMPGGEGETGELRFRLSRLWQPHGFEVWYDLQYDADYPDSGPYAVSIPEQPCLDRIPGKVKPALDSLEAHGIPYLKNAVGLPASHANGVPPTQ